MRLTNKQEKDKQTAEKEKEATVYLDLSATKLASIDNLEYFSNLKHLLLRHNELNCLFGLEKCKELWRIDANRNKIKNLDGLSKFVAIGTLDLDGNDFGWLEFEKIRHLHIIDLITTNNLKLERELNCLAFF